MEKLDIKVYPKQNTMSTQNAGVYWTELDTISANGDQPSGDSTNRLYATVPGHDSFILDDNLVFDGVIEDKRKMMRLIPCTTEMEERGSRVLYNSVASEMFGTNPDNPGELVRLNCRNNTMPIKIDVVPITYGMPLTDINGWNLFRPTYSGSHTIPVRFMEDGTLFSLSKNDTIGQWSIRHEGGFALWQQPHDWGIICRRAVTHRIHVSIPREGETYFVLLFDKNTKTHYLQQDCSYFQKIDGQIMMADIFGNPAWAGEPRLMKRTCIIYHYR